jgi:hypothetical protein
MARCDEFAKWADPLCGEVASMWFDLEELPHGCGQESKQATKTGKERMRGKGHG